MGTCKNCKWWSKNYSAFKNACAFDVDGISEAEKQAKKNESGQTIQFHAWDDSGLEAGLVTGPNFGCVNFGLKKMEEKK